MVSFVMMLVDGLSSTKVEISLKTLTYEVRSTIIFPCYRVSGFAGNSRTQKLNKAHTKQANITGVHYFRRLWSFARINKSGINFVLSFILSLFYFITICANFPFRLRLCLLLRICHSTLPPFLIACTLRQVLHSCPSIQQPLLSQRYNFHVQLPPDPLPLVGVPATFSPPPLTPPPLSLPPLSPPLSPPPQENLFPCLHRFRCSPIFLPQNRHCPRRCLGRHPRPHWRRRHLAPRLCRVCQSPLLTSSSPHFRCPCRPCLALLLPLTLPFLCCSDLGPS